jgi:nucleotide-binding universal stress UspA family protein
MIVPLDGSELSERAIPIAASLARSLNGELLLIHVLEEPIAFDMVPSLILPDRTEAERYLKRVFATLPPAPQASVMVIRGNPTEELLRLAEETPDTIIVMSTHGRGGLGRVVFGSVADKVMRGATTPVVLVRDGGKTITNGILNLLVPLDGSELAEQIIPLAEKLTKHGGATLHLVRVVEPLLTGAYATFAAEAVYLNDEQVDDLEQELQAEARAHLDAVASALRARGARVVWEVRSGKAADEIIRAAETSNADLILMSSHGRGGIRRWAFGSIANEVIHRGVAPVLVMPPGAQLAGDDSETIAAAKDATSAA